MLLLGSAAAAGPAPHCAATVELHRDPASPRRLVPSVGESEYRVGPVGEGQAALNTQQRGGQPGGTYDRRCRSS